MNFSKEDLMTLTAGAKGTGGDPIAEAGDTGIVEVSSGLRRKLGMLEIIF